ncbi:enoyl-CoA hydratase/isomerase family protein [Caballeronia sp. LZ001]|uniref:enoyl-CoA hydratase/isomerase family protein n=1 Tax=Caballeronia sp. LZ001 TaxID=3038553 RepID=UPI00285A299D|nr:enoyl-CoA hydratase/isomerase family protein [Caballeronia sp. LZ001]MDR5804876.1 enoyl-CoA hydratase/isomerase family protein [Caballeronia sp. LZ001]
MNTSPLLVTLQKQERIAIIELNNPAKRNALGAQVRELLHAAVRTAVDDTEVRAIVLTGAGGHFSAGGDISEMRERSILEHRTRWDLLNSLTRMIARGPKPVVSAVEGSAMGAGLSLAALADYAIAAEGAKLGAAFVRMGLVPDLGALWSVQRRVGPARAREMLGLGRILSAEQAERIGLVNERCETGHALERAIEVAREYAQLPPLAAALLKAALAEGADTLDAALRTEMECQSVAMTTADHREAVTAFLEKRQAVFKGN